MNKKLLKILLFSFKLLFRLIVVGMQLGFIAVVGVGGVYILQLVGVIGVNVPVVGSSMRPTLPDAGYISVQRYTHNPFLQKTLQQTIGRGDLVVFANEKTAEELQKQHKQGSGFVKRVVGVAGDRLIIRDGFVLLNDELLQEQYTLKPRSTFGGTEIRDCQGVAVPEGYVFVLGDNRKISLDSRHIGLVPVDDIEYYIPYERQKNQLSGNWRDTTNDLEAGQTSLFSIMSYLNLLNEERSKAGIPPLLYQPKLEQSARKRAEAMITYDDFSFEATKSGYPMSEALRDVDYSNTVFGEFPILGYYDAQELIDAFLAQRKARDFLLNKEYQEIGISTFVGNLNGCPVQVVVQHLAGYVPPNYKQSDIDSWKHALSRLREAQVSWERLKSVPETYDQHRADIDRINEIINLRLAHIDAIVKRLEANEWLTEEERRFMREDEGLSEEQNMIAERLNQ